MKRKIVAFMIALGLMLALGAVYASAASFENSFETEKAGEPYDLEDWVKSGWNAPWLLGNDRSQVDDEVSRSGFKSLKVLYPAGKIGPTDSGYQAPFAFESEDEYYLSYWVRFDENFSWGTTQFGGKLGIGLAGGGACSGGQICTGENGFSSRLIWRKDGQAAVYIYSMGNSGYGAEADLKYHNGEPIYYPTGEWFNIVQRLKVNTVTNGQANADGEIEIWYNGFPVTEVTGLKFVTNTDKVDKAYFSSFYGGATETYAPAHDSYVWYDDVKISANRADMCELDPGGCGFKDPMQDYRITPASVSASAVDGTNVAANTIDNDFTTRWSAEGEQWILYDLGQSLDLSQVSIGFFQSAIRNTIFRIEGSDDGDTWNLLFDGRSSSRFTELEPFTLVDAKARYVRISGTGNTINRWNSITETVFYGTEKTVVDPGTEEPGTEEPGTEEPGTEEPGTEEPGTEEPGTEEPGTEEPGTEEPSTENPGSQNPGTINPGTQEPVVEEPEVTEPEAPVVDMERVSELVSNHWAKAELTRAAELGIWVLPAEGETFAPNKPVSRAEWVLMLVRALGLETSSKGTAFPDLSGQDAESKKAIAAAMQAGIINGFEDGTFRPDEEVTRAQMAVMLTRALKLTTNSVPSESLFADDRSLPAWARDSVYALSGQGVLRGRNGKAFAPADNTTFAEGIVALLRAIDLPANKK
ncbi:polysaccharide lyase [Paenibacillus sp. strain BS8-2]